MPLSSAKETTLLGPEFKVSLLFIPTDDSSTTITLSFYLLVLLSLLSYLSFSFSTFLAAILASLAAAFSSAVRTRVIVLGVTALDALGVGLVLVPVADSFGKP